MDLLPTKVTAKKVFENNCKTKKIRCSRRKGIVAYYNLSKKNISGTLNKGENLHITLTLTVRRLQAGLR